MDEKIAQAIGEEENARWQSTHKAIYQELLRSESDFKDDLKLARELTSQIVASTRDEEKAALASDEAVAHGLSKLRKRQTHEMGQLMDQPYFARVVTEEEGRKVEFRLGTASFPSQRIVDWRKAPISKLYYDYTEGEEFAETIQGREREGVINLRRSYQGQEDKLNVIETKQGTVYWHEDKWNFDASGLSMSRKPGHDGHLPPILSLITPDQFKLITNDPKSPMIIQGVAGSGKTTVALHRLAWLLHEDNSDIKAEKTMVVMLNRSLKAYVETTLPELNIEGVALRTYNQWVNALLKNEVGERKRCEEKPHPKTEQFKSSAQVLAFMEAYVQETKEKYPRDIKDDYFAFIQFLSRQTITGFPDHLIKGRISHQWKNRFYDLTDDTLLLHLFYSRNNFLPRGTDGLSALDHIVIDECQDFGITEMKALLLALNEERTLTLVGDRAQKIVEGRNFGSWEEFLGQMGIQNLKPVELNVSYRTTEEIMELARIIRSDGTAATPIITKRHGPEPKLIRADSVEVIPNLVGQWVDERVRESAHSLSAVICRWPKDAQKLTDQLRHLGHSSVRLGYRDHFTFAPGVVITNAAQVKGLEFRNVLIVEPTQRNYSEEKEEERNLLYVAVTRAEVLLDIVSTHPLSDLLPEFYVEEEVAEGEEKKIVEDEILRDPDTGEIILF